MNITKFFNLSILEVEKYLDLNTKIFTNKPGPSRSLTKEMGLIGITNWKFERDKKIHIVKKANIYRVYSINTSYPIKDTTEYWLAFHMSLGGGDSHSLLVKISPKTKTIMGFKCYKEGIYHEAVDKTKKLSDYII